jgi:rhamnose transport system permease protein
MQNERPFSAKRFFLQWEWMLAMLFVAINIMNALLSPNYLVFDSLMSAIQMFMDKAILVFPMMLVILLGDIDISIASTMALSAVVMGVSHQAGASMPASILLAIATGSACGLLNGFLLVKFKELSSMIVTLAGMIIFRGIASIILEDGAAGNFPSWFQFLGWGYWGKVPFALVFFAIEAAIFTFAIHFTRFGRSVYAMGNNEEAARYSGIQADRTRLLIFTLMGLFSAASALFLVSKMGSVRPSMAKGYEMDIIAMVVLGGVSNNGGKGRVLGVVIAAFIVGLLRHGLGIINIPSQTIMIIVGALLIVAIVIPNLKTTLGSLRLFCKNPSKR